MREHLEDHWALYAALICIFGLCFLLVVVLVEEQRRNNVCFDRGMVLVDTSAGAYCAPLNTLQRI